MSSASSSCEGIKFRSGGVEITIRCQPHCDYKNPADPEEEARIIREEDEWNAMDTLGSLVVHRWPEIPEPWKNTTIGESWQNYLMYLIKPVCRHYKVSDDNVLSMFMKHYLLSILLSSRHQKNESTQAQATEGTQGSVQTLSSQDSSVQSGE